jgi:GTP cyclohydrolase I
MENTMSQINTEKYVKKMLEEGLGLDLTDPNLKDTPKRVAKMLHQELLHNIIEEFPGESFSKFPNTHNYSQIILMDHIHFTSMCSHHFLPFEGVAFFAYIPDGFLVGASKMARLIEHYGARPQLQENLCHEIMNRFVEVVRPKGAMLITRAIHGCMTSRGVKQYANAGMTTSVISGCFNDPTVREECMDLIKLSTVLR